MENKTKTIKLYAKEIQKDKQKFISSSTEINKKWYKVKFTKDCNVKPEQQGWYELTFEYDGCSIEKGKTYVRKDGKRGTENDTLWIRNVIKLRKFTDEEMNEAKREQLDEVFGEI